MIDIEKMRKQFEEERQIRCPFCQSLQTTDDGNYPMTYHGSWDSGVTEMDCYDCEKTFWIFEQVSRTYKVGRTPEEAEER